jgi:hypothetical protein
MGDEDEEEEDRAVADGYSMGRGVKQCLTIVTCFT